MVQHLLQLGYIIALGNGTNTSAEMFALLHGLMHCKRQGWLPLIVEVDVELMLNWYKCKHTCPAKYSATWKRITQLGRELDIIMTHTYREGNGTAGGLSKLGSSQHSQLFWNASMLPRQIRAAYFLDKIGTATIRQ
ncbi:hypothetical protein GIB67_014771 [Kingdonia uniflora]|uniref:RNase H type-1 domain-containing protein n=1 Tax=Kingdonia uniflora TaxID=39325 RepID=A0A7J7NVG3_9MAGN|nr:hypothetical protein GIB67_014771 [Kingdonia uniflora]